MKVTWKIKEEPMELRKKVSLACSVIHEAIGGAFEFLQDSDNPGLVTIRWMEVDTTNGKEHDKETRVGMFIETDILKKDILDYPLSDMNLSHSIVKKFEEV